MGNGGHDAQRQEKGRYVWEVHDAKGISPGALDKRVASFEEDICMKVDPDPEDVCRMRIRRNERTSVCSERLSSQAMCCARE